MNDQTLFDKQEAVKAQFDKLTVDKANKDTEIENMVIEMNRLQGEYRALGSLRTELESVTKAGTPVYPVTDAHSDLLANVKEAKNGKK